MSRQAVIHNEAILPVKAMVWVENWDGTLGVAIDDDRPPSYLAWLDLAVLAIRTAAAQLQITPDDIYETVGILLREEGRPCK